MKPGVSPEHKPTDRNLPVRALVINGLAIALVFVAATFVHIRIPVAGTGGMIHLGDLPIFVFALLYGRKTGGLAGALGLTLFDILSGWTLWAPFTFVISGAMGWVVGAAAEQNPEGQPAPYWLSIMAAALITAGGYYVTECLLYGNWLSPLGSVPVNLLQVVLPAVPALLIAKRLRKVA